MEYTTDEYRHAVAGSHDAPSILRFNWADKPHRLVYDLCAEIEILKRQLAQYKRYPEDEMDEDNFTLEDAMDGRIPMPITRRCAILLTEVQRLQAEPSELIELVGYMGESTHMVFATPGKPEAKFIPVYKKVDKDG